MRKTIGDTETEARNKWSQNKINQILQHRKRKRRKKEGKTERKKRRRKQQLDRSTHISKELITKICSQYKTKANQKSN